MRKLVTFILFCSFCVSYSQDVRYDSLQNINQNNFMQLVGQTLYYPDGEIVISNLFWVNKRGKIYKPVKKRLYEKYSINEYVLGKHFVIEQIITGSNVLLKTRIKENNDVVYINLDALLNSTISPVLFVDGFIQKCKELYLNKYLYVDKFKLKKSLSDSSNTIVPTLAKLYCNNLRIATIKNYGGVLLLSINGTQYINIQDYLNARISEDDANKMIRLREVQMKREAEQERLRKLQQADEYRTKNKWDVIPLRLGDFGCLQCCICNSGCTGSDSYYPTFIYVDNDSIFWKEEKDGYFYEKKIIYHCSALPKKLKENPEFKFHYEVFQDSLNERKYMASEYVISMLNMAEELDYMGRIEKLAPFGFINKRSWNADYDILSFTMQYVNTNVKTIKYIEVFWYTKNDVGDIRDRGSVRGTGPVEYWHSGYWSWDDVDIVTRDVTSFGITKIVITYMDGTKKVLPENKIAANRNEYYLI